MLLWLALKMNLFLILADLYAENGWLGIQPSQQLWLPNLDLAGNPVTRIPGFVQPCSYHSYQSPMEPFQTKTSLNLLTMNTNDILSKHRWLVYKNMFDDHLTFSSPLVQVMCKLCMFNSIISLLL